MVGWYRHGSMEKISLAKVSRDLRPLFALLAVV
jgi:hypothetical protein